MKQEQLESNPHYTKFLDKTQKPLPLARLHHQNHLVTFKTCPYQPLSEEEQQNSKEYHPSKRKIISKRYPLNLIQSIQRQITSNLMFNLYGIATIDEKGLLKQGEQCSLIKSQFNFYAVNSVEIRPGYVIIRTQENRKNQFPMSYYIQRLKCYGDTYLYNMAIQIDFLKQLFEHFFGSPQKVMSQQCPFEGLIEPIKNLPFILRVYPATLVVSNKLVELLGFTVQSLAGECLTLRSFIADLFWNDDYRQEIDIIFELIDNRMKFRKGLISEEEYLRNGRRSSIMNICTKQEKIIKVRVERYNIVPNVYCEVIQKILSHEKHPAITNNQEQNFKELKSQYLQQTYDKTIHNIESLMTVPQNLRRQNQHRTCGYRALRGRRWAR